MKILYILPKNNFFSQLNGVGGHIAHCKGVINALSTEFKILVITGKEKLPIPIEANDNIKIVSLDFSPSKIISVIFEIKKIVNEIKPRFIYTRYSFKSFYIPALIKIINKSSRIILEVNSLAVNLSKKLKLADQIALSSSNLILCISDELKAKVLQKYKNTDKDKIIVLQNGVDISRFKTKEISEKSNNSLLKIGYTGTLKFNYGIECLIDAVKETVDCGINVQFNIAGTGPAKENLAKLSNGYDQIIFHGKIDYEKIPDFLQKQDILLYSTSEQNFFQSPIKIYEYMAAAKPIIAMSTPTTELLLENNISGILVPVGNSTEITASIKSLSESPTLRETLSINVRIKAHNHDWTSRMESLLTTLKFKGWIV